MLVVVGFRHEALPNIRGFLNHVMVVQGKPEPNSCLSSPGKGKMYEMYCNRCKGVGQGKYLG